MLTGLFKNASFRPPPNLHKFISLVEVYRFGQCLGWRFWPKSTFFSLVSSRAFRDAPHSRFRCGDPHQCSRNFLKMLRLALPQLDLSIWTVLKVAETWLRAAWFWTALGRFRGTWMIFPSPRDSKLIREDFAFQWIGKRKKFWTLGYEQSGWNIATWCLESRRDRATCVVILTNFRSIFRILGDISESQGL